MNHEIHERLNPKSNTLEIFDNPSEEEIKAVQNGLTNHNKKFPSGGLDIPTPDISLVLRDSENNIVGGVITSMLVGIMHLEVLWVDEKIRGLGLGRDLVLEAERLGREKGYRATQAWTFSFQAPEFYQSIGYKIIGIFEGYCDGVTEYVLSKKFGENQLKPSTKEEFQKKGYSIIKDKSEETMKAIHEGLRTYMSKRVGVLRKKHPEVAIQLVLKDEKKKVVGGLLAFSTLKAVNFEYLWIDEYYRKKGYGKQLLETAEKVALSNKCQSMLVMVYSFQNLEFFQKHGFEIFGFSDNYPDSIKEYYLIKWLK
jgi:ribosomal protein S18 acetylase RimI-like enzyme